MKPLTGSIETHFREALEGLVAQLKEDRSILATILCGSLSYDAVWAKSDIDLVLVTIDEKKLDHESVALNADGVNVHASLMRRTDFRQTVQRATRNSFFHSLLARGRLLYTHDETITGLCAELHTIGERDTQIQLLAAGLNAISTVDKAHKWLITRGDLNYSALWILYAATSLARIEVLSARLLADREVLLQAIELNPDFFTIVYTAMLNTKKTRKNLEAALEAVDNYLDARAPALFRLVIEHLEEVGEARSATEIENHFKRHFNVEGVTIACEYLSHRKLIGKASIGVQLTRRSNVAMQELAFVALGETARG